MQELYAVFTIEKKLGAQLYHMGSILSLLLHLKAVTKDAKKKPQLFLSYVTALWDI